MQQAMAGMMPHQVQAMAMGARGGMLLPGMPGAVGSPPLGAGATLAGPRDDSGVNTLRTSAASMPDRAIPPQLQQLPLQQQQQFLVAAQSQALLSRMLQEGGAQGFGLPPGMMHGGPSGMSGAPRVFIPAQNLPSNLHPMLGHGGSVGFVNGGGYVRAHMPFLGGGGVSPAGGRGGAPGAVPQIASAGHVHPGVDVATGGSPPNGSASIAVPLLAVSHPAGLATHAGQLSMHGNRVSMPMSMLNVAGPGGAQILHPGNGSPGSMNGFCMPVGGQGGPVGMPAGAMLPGGGIMLPAQGMPGMGGMQMQWPQGRLVCVDGRLGHAGPQMRSGASRAP